MPRTPVAAALHRLLAPLVARCRSGARRGRRGSIAILTAVSFLPLSIAAGVAVDMSRMADARSALQRATDNAALSGAAAYIVYTPKDTFNATAKTMAKSAFCNAVTALPAGFTLVATSSSTACASGQGPAVSAVIAGYTVGTRGVTPNSGCSATNTVVGGNVTCGFIVTVATSATVRSIFPFISGGLLTVSTTSSAINPFINLAKAITPSFQGSAANANSLWIYPLLLDANGAPDFATNNGALPDASSCTGNPTQTSCGSYTMLASTLFYSNCPSPVGCNVNGTVFVNGVVQNPVVGTAVITATTPLGVAFQSAAGAGTGSPNYYFTVQPGRTINDTACDWPSPAAYNTVAQAMDANGYPLVTDGKGNWPLVTHWFYSSFLANNQPPDYNEIAQQLNTTTNYYTGYKANVQIIPAVRRDRNVNTGKDFDYKAIAAAPVDCPDPYSTPFTVTPPTKSNSQALVTSYPTTGATNCALYIAKDPGSLYPNGNYAGNNVCFTPGGTPGYQYSALSCQNYAGHNYAFFWNDMSGRYGDDTDYGNGTLQISCAGASYVLLIN